MTSANIGDVAPTTLSEDDKAAVADGANATLTLRVHALGNVGDADAQAASALISQLGATAGSWNDLSLSLAVQTREDRAATQTGNAVKLAVAVPNALRKDGRTFWLIRVHDGMAEILANGTGTTLEGESKLFSSYLIAYKDAATAATAATQPAARTTVPSTGDASLAVAPLLVGLGLAALAAARRLQAEL
ncbi:MAG: hypothetical protein IKG18_02140 [Atopobiaceae bacterium]|nr:hypothetical protein [Atopobiaceae bacterium]